MGTSTCSASSRLDQIDVTNTTNLFTVHLCIRIHLYIPQVRVMMAVGWMAFLGSWLMNILFYKVHPSSVDFSKKGMREKLFIHVQGEKRFLPGYKKWESKGEKY